MREIEPEVRESLKEMGPMVSSDGKSEKSKKIYPTLRFDHKFFPEMKKFEVGKMYKVTLELKTTGLSISKFQNDSEFEVHGFESENMKNMVDNKKE